MCFDSDSDVLDACCAEVLKSVPIVRVLEIGMWAGYTARGMKKFIEEKGGAIDYWGMDPGILTAPKEPFPGAHVIHGKSEECFHLVPDDFDIIFVDGDHSRNAVILDTYNYAPKVVPGGFLIFHDTNPKCQHTGYEYDGPHIPQFGIAVREAWAMMEWPWKPWTLWMERYHPAHHQNGTTAWKKG
jgi:SAM-dependent methyltransferase